MVGKVSLFVFSVVFLFFDRITKYENRQCVHFRCTILLEPSVAVTFNGRVGILYISNCGCKDFIRLRYFLTAGCVVPKISSIFGEKC